MVAWNMGQVSLGFMPVVGVWGCSEVLGGGGLLIWGGGSLWVGPCAGSLGAVGGLFYNTVLMHIAKVEWENTCIPPRSF